MELCCACLAQHDNVNTFCLMKSVKSSNVYLIKWQSLYATENTIIRQPISAKTTNVSQPQYLPFCGRQNVFHKVYNSIESKVTHRKQNVDHSKTDNIKNCRILLSWIQLKLLLYFIHFLMQCHTTRTASFKIKTNMVHKKINKSTFATLTKLLHFVLLRINIISSQWIPIASYMYLTARRRRLCTYNRWSCLRTGLLISLPG